ncbi:uncharacterized protein LOC128603804 isoform X3 [Ictalurus furcatus]|uniref:uncharacterized protein LOC128603804 isoform X3 n=1 Tax=Ictalurus furcatus TaxID=66913 RepID=UPI00234FE3C7|nr:uncharacterized protein LOC128603804 isoform X3 [Ictalurus furcatus]
MVFSHISIIPNKPFSFRKSLTKCCYWDVGRTKAELRRDHMTYAGRELCKSYCTDRSNISIKLQSDVLLPCTFNPTLLGSDKTADIAVVWSQRNTTIHHLVEITLQGEVKFWDSKHGRIKTFPKLSESGNFSILLQKVQPYDLGLYHCELFNGTGCRIAYQELQLDTSTDPVFHQAIIITGASTGAVLLCLFIASVIYIGNRRRHRLHPESTRGCSHDNPDYVSYSHGRDETLVSENPIYETVWNRGGSM